jgi:tRNA(Arg) A34 adenosine deaminase TadA
MRLAIEASARALDGGDMPFGATMVLPDGTIHVSQNRQLTGADVTAHAEVVVVREATALFGAKALRGSTVYASGEPCPMCAGTMFWAGVTRVVYGATANDIIDALGEPSMPLRIAEALAGTSPVVTIEGPLLVDEAVAVLLRFKTRTTSEMRTP